MKLKKKKKALNSYIFFFHFLVHPLFFSPFFFLNKNSFFSINKLLECCVIIEGSPGGSNGRESAYSAGDLGSAVFETTVSTCLGSLTLFKLQLKLYYL